MIRAASHAAPKTLVVTALIGAVGILALLATGDWFGDFFQSPEDLAEVQAPQAIAEIPKNLSGVTWNADTGTLFAVTNNPELIFELTTEGRVLRTIALRGFADTEDVVHITGALFALVEERRGALCIFNLPADAREVSRDEGLCTQLEHETEKNKGLESLAYAPASRTIHTMREGKPFVRLSIPLDNQVRPGQIARTSLTELQVKDAAAISIDPDGTLWVLSEASSRLVHLDQDGHELRRFKLNAAEFFRPEGLTRSPDGRIFVVGEPNILAVYRTTE